MPRPKLSKSMETIICKTCGIEKTRRKASSFFPKKGDTYCSSKCSGQGNAKKFGALYKSI